MSAGGRGQLASTLDRFWDPAVRAWPAGMVAGVVAFVIYAASASRYVSVYDCAELQALAGTGGIAHAAYPTLVLLERLVSWVPLGTLAWRANLLSGAMGAIAIGALAYAAMRLTRHAAASVAASLAFALSYTMWNESAQVGVHTLTLAIGALAFLALLRFVHQPSAGFALAIGVLVGLGLAAHMTIVAIGIAIAWAGVLLIRARTLRIAHVLLLVGGLVLGLLPYLYTLEHDKPGLRINYMNDTFVEGNQPDTPWAPDLSHRGARLLWLLSGRQYFSMDMYSFRTLPRRVAGIVAAEGCNEFPLPSLFIAIAGFLLILAAGGQVAGIAGAWMLGAVIATARGGTSWTGAWFFLPGAWLLGLGLAVVCARAWERRAAFGMVLAVGLIALPLVRLSLREPPGPLARVGLLKSVWDVWPKDWSPLRRDARYETFARESARVLPPNAIVLASWGPCGPLRYVLWAQKARPDVDVRFAPNTDGERWLRRWREAAATGRPVFDADEPGPEALAGGTAEHVLTTEWAGLWRLHPAPDH